MRQMDGKRGGGRGQARGLGRERITLRHVPQKEQYTRSLIRRGFSKEERGRKTRENLKTATERQNERESTHATETQSTCARYRET